MAVCALLGAWFAPPGLAQAPIVELTLLSRGQPSDTANGSSAPQALSSADGRYQLLSSRALNLVDGVVDNNAASDVFLRDRVTGVVTLVSRSAAAPTTAGNGESAPTAISADGEWVLFRSRATNLVAGVSDGNNANDTFLFQRSTGTVTLVSRSGASPTATANGESLPTTISADGEWVAFQSAATDLMPGGTDGNGAVDAFLYGRSAGTVTLLSRTFDSPTTTSDSFFSSPTAISPTGDWVLLQSGGTNHVAGISDSNFTLDAFLYERSTGTLTLISRTAASPTTAANGASAPVAMSADSEWILFRSSARNLITGVTDNNTGDDVFLYQRSTGAVTLVSRSQNSPLDTGSQTSVARSISADGEWVLFTSFAPNLISGYSDLNSRDDVFLYQRSTGNRVLVSRSAASATTTANEASTARAISADGEWVLFESAATDIGSGVSDTNGGIDSWLYQRSSGERTLVSRSASSATATANGASLPTALSADGEWVLFGSAGTDLVAGVNDANLVDDAFQFQRSTGTVSLLSSTGNTTPLSANNSSNAVAISADGEWTVLQSSATNLLAGVTDSNGIQTDVYLRQRSTGALTLVSRSAALAGTTANARTTLVAMSPDGEWLLLESIATNLVAGLSDGNGAAGTDVYLYRRSTGTFTLVSRSFGSATTTGNSRSEPIALSPDGEWVLFGSFASNLIAGMSASNGDVYLFQRSTGTVTLASRSAASATIGGNAVSRPTALSSDGEWVLFGSSATDLLPGTFEGNTGSDVFLFRRSTGAVTLVSRSATVAGTATGNGISLPLAMSSDGEWTVFDSNATDLVSGLTDINGVSRDVFLYQNSTGTLTLVTRSSASATTTANGASFAVAISPDGEWLLFRSFGTNLLAGVTDTNGSADDVYLYRRSTGTLTLASRNSGSASTTGNAQTLARAMSPDGEWVLLDSRASDLVPGFIDGNGSTSYDSYSYRRSTGEMVLVSRSTVSAGAGGNSTSQGVTLTPDGRLVLFTSNASNLDAAVLDGNGAADVFLARITQPDATATSITADLPDPSVVGQTVPVQVAVTGTTTAPADGTVTINASTGESCTDSTPAAGGGNIAVYGCDLTFSSTGSRNLIATFSASATHLGSTSAGEAHNVVNLPTLSINDVSLVEGNSGVTTFQFTVTRSHTINAVSVDVGTADNTANAPADYGAISAQTINFAAGGAATAAVNVSVVGDLLVEPTETFFVNLSNIVGGTPLDAQGQGTIQNDDVPDFTITTTATAITVTDFSGNGSTLQASEPVAGTLRLAAAGRTFQVNGGTPLVGDSGNLALAGISSISVSAAGGVAVAAGAVMNIGQSNYSSLNAITLAGGTLRSSGTAFVSAPLVLGADSDLAAGGGTMILGTIISGDFTLRTFDVGTYRFDSTGSTFSRLNIAAGVVTLARDNGLPAAVDVFNSSVLDLNGFDQTIDFYAGSGETRSLSLGSALIIGVAGSSSTFGAANYVGPINGAINLSVASGANQTFGSNASTYGGSTVIDGTLVITGTRALGGVSGTVVSDGGTLDLRNVVYAEVEPLSLWGGTLRTSSGSSSFPGPLVFEVRPSTVRADGSLRLDGAIGGTRGFSKTGAGTLWLTATNAVGGAITVSAGHLLISGITASTGVTVNGGRVGGNGRIGGTVQVLAGGALAPGLVAPFGSVVGRLQTDSITSAAAGSMAFDVNGTGAGSGHDQLDVTGTVSLGGASLAVAGSHVASFGESFLLIANDGADPVTGTFAGLAEGATLSLNGVLLSISYVGGDGNDVVLSVVPPTPSVWISVDPGAVAEDGSANLSYTVTRSLNLPFATTVNLEASGTATPGSDYSGDAVSVTIPANSTVATLVIDPTPDSVVEPNESVTLGVAAGTGYTIGIPSIATGTISNDDSAGVIIVQSGGSTTVTEGGTTDTYDVRLASEPTANVTVTLDAGAEIGVSPGSLIFTPANWNVQQTVTVIARDDNLVEGPHNAAIVHTPSGSDPVYASLPGTQITVSITDNDSAVVSFAPASVSQSEATSPMVFSVTLSNPVASGVTVAVNSTPGTATAADFTAITGGTVSFAPSSTTAQTLNVTIANDVLDEDDESFSLTLSGLVATGNVNLGAASATGTIVDDDAMPTLSITSPSQDEGNAGPAPMNFVVSLSAVSGRNVSFTRATADGSATVANNDYVAIASGSVTIPAGQMSVTIPVTINGDTTFEGNETFALNLTGISNATPGTLAGTGTILEDDQQPTTTVITSRTPTATVVGQPYTVAVTVTAQSTSPTGSVTVSDGSASCSAALVTGTAPASTMSCSLTSTTAGTKTLTASYTASTTAFANSSGTTSHLVNPAATTISVSGPARSRINQPTAFSFALAVTAPGAGTPTGTVTLSSGSVSCTATLPATSCNLTFPALGSRTVTASYASDGNYAASTSSGLPTLVYALSDVSITKTDGEATYQPGDLIVYTVQVRNAGPDAAAQVRVQDIVPAGLSAVTWTCDASGGAVCSPSGGTGNLDMTLASLPVGALWNYTFYGTVTGLPEQIVNTATLTLPADTTIEDPNPGNNSATDISVLESLFANGFEASLVNGPEGTARLPTAALAPVLDEAARIVFKLDDKRGEMARVYARLHLGAVEYALATRGADGRWTLGPWTGYAVVPTLSWNAELTAGSWQLTRVELR